MGKIKTFLVVGARPNFMKIAPIHKELIRRARDFEPVIVHTGQHYDEKMSKIFFDDLELPRPDIYLGVGSGSHAVQTAEIMKKFEKELLKFRPELIILVGDVNSTLACSLTAMKIRYSSEQLHRLWTAYYAQIDQTESVNTIPAHLQVRKDSMDRPLIAHVEAGLRSFDYDMPEEINRMVTDSLSDLLFTTCQDGNDNLVAEGHDPRKIFLVGNVMIDALQTYMAKSKDSSILQELNHGKNGDDLRPDQYVLVTLHRPGNVDYPENLRMILSSLVEISHAMPVIFPIHPRTRKLLTRIDVDLHDGNFLLTEPIGYLDFLNLQTNARLVITDSGGIQEETSYLGVPCLTLRPNTERPITISRGTNRLVALNRESIVKEALSSIKDGRRQPANIKYWDGQSAGRIADILSDLLSISKN